MNPRVCAQLKAHVLLSVLTQEKLLYQTFSPTQQIDVTFKRNKTLTYDISLVNFFEKTETQDAFAFRRAIKGRISLLCYLGH